MQTNAKTPLPEFKEVIKIEVPVAMIHGKMLEALPADYKHKEILAHAIVGSAQSAGKLAYIYNALFGFENIIDFQVGDKVICTVKDRDERYDRNKEDEYGKPKLAVSEVEDKPSWSLRDAEIGRCEIVDIDLYGEKKLKVQFMQDKRYGDGQEETTIWVDHTKCTMWWRKGEKSAVKYEAVESVSH